MTTGESAPERRYWAFVSHSHADGRWAAWLVRQLEAYAVPSKLVGRLTPAGPAPRRFRPIFRDREELAANASLRNQIERVLDRSEYLILVCSPDAARSSWVNEEVAYFRATHDDSRVFCVIVGGEPWASEIPDKADQECFPAALRAPRADTLGGERFQPIAADLRAGGDGQRLARMKLLSGMLGVGLGDLTNREARRRQQRLAAMAAASFTGMVVMGGLASVALEARNEAQAQRRQAEGLIEFMLSDLRKRLEPAGQLDVLEAVGKRAMNYYSAQSPDSLDADSLSRRSRVLHLVGEVSDEEGDLPGALSLFRQAALSTGELLKRQPGNPQRIFDHAQSVYWVGYIAWRRGQVDEALNRFSEYRALADRLTAIDPKNDVWRAEVAYADADLGSVFQENSRSEEAARAFDQSLKIRLDLVAHAPNDRGRLVDLGQSYAGVADAKQTMGDPAAALTSRIAERKIYSELLARNANDSEVTQSLAVNREAMAKILLQQRRFSDAVNELRTAARAGQALVDSDPKNTEFPAELAGVYVLLGQAELQAGSPPEVAATDARRALTLAESLVRKDPTVVDWAGRRLGGARALAMKVEAQRASSRRAFLAALAGAPEEFQRLARLSDAHPHDLLVSGVAAEAAVLAGDREWVAGDRVSAASTWAEGVKILHRAGELDPIHRYDRGRVLLAQLEARADNGPPQGAGEALPRYLW